MAMQSHPDTGKKTNRAYTKRTMLAAISVLVTITVILSVLWLGGHEDELFSLSQVQGGVLCSIHLDSTNWTHKYLKIENGDRNAFWSLQSANLSAGTWAVEEYELQPLGDVLLRLHVIDAEGDGRMGQGDSIVVTASGSAGFSPDLIYSFALWQGHIAISGVVSKMSFWFEDGQLATSSMETIVYPY
jgi:hypothetical protein